MCGCAGAGGVQKLCTARGFDRQRGGCGTDFDTQILQRSRSSRVDRSLQVGEAARNRGEHTRRGFRCREAERAFEQRHIRAEALKILWADLSREDEQPRSSISPSETSHVHFIADRKTKAI